MNAPKKSLGQHWLRDKASLEAMARAGLARDGDVVLEIGPGHGTLTQVLLGRGARVIAVEKDEQLAEKLAARINSARFKIVSADILEFDLNELPRDYKVVANIPYYLTSQLIRVLGESANPPKVAALLVQKEVAERLAARPGQMSLLSVSAQVYYQPTLKEVVLAELFAPPPKVDSQIIQLLRRPQPLVAGDLRKAFFRVVKAGFSNRRKTVENSLAAGLRTSKEEAVGLLAKAGIKPHCRPQELSISDWKSIAELVR